jgi:hypothetical protein
VVMRRYARRVEQLALLLEQTGGHA